MKVLLASHHPFNPSAGVSGGIWRWGQSLIKIGVNVDFYFHSAFSEKTGFKRLFPPYYDFFQIKKMLKKKNYDIIDISSRNGYPLFLYQKLFNKNNKTKFVMRSHGLEPQIVEVFKKYREWESLSFRWRIYSEIINYYEIKTAIGLCDGVIVTSTEQKEYIIKKKWKKEKDIYIIPHTIDEIFFKNHKTEYKNPPRALFVGPWTKRKGKDVLVSAFRELWKKGIPIPLTLVGVGNSETEIMKEFGEDFKKFLKIFPYSDNKKLREIYIENEIFVFPSLYEGFGIVLLEASSLGLAIITTPVGFARDFLENNKSAIFIEKNAPEDLVSKIKFLVRNPDIIIKLGKSAKECSKDFTWEKIGKRLLEIYERIIDKKWK